MRQVVFGLIFFLSAILIAASAQEKAVVETKLSVKLSFKGSMSQTAVEKAPVLVTTGKEKIHKLKTDETGTVTFDLPMGATYELVVTTKKFYEKKIMINAIVPELYHDQDFAFTGNIVLTEATFNATEEITRMLSLAYSDKWGKFMLK